MLTISAENRHYPQLSFYPKGDDYFDEINFFEEIS
jgi:hypothetical protein